MCEWEDSKAKSTEKLFEWAISKKALNTSQTSHLILVPDHPSTHCRGGWILSRAIRHTIFLSTKTLPELLVVVVPNPENPVVEVFNPNPPNPVEAVVLALNPEKSPPLVVVVEPNPENRELDVVVVVVVLPKLNAVAVPVGFDPNPPKAEINVLFKPLKTQIYNTPWTQDVTWSSRLSPELFFYVKFTFCVQGVDGMTAWPESLVPCSNFENSKTLIPLLVYVVQSRKKRFGFECVSTIF